MILNVISVTILAATTLSPQYVKFDMTLEKSSYYPGEPIGLKLTLTNLSNLPLEECRLAMDWFEFNIRSKNGNREYLGERKQIYNLHTSYWPRCYKREALLPQGKISGDIALLEWFYQSFEVGDYDILCKIYFSYKRKEKVEITCPLHIMPQDEQAHRLILKRVYETIDMERIGSDTCLGPCELIVSARSSFVVEYLLKMLRPVPWDLNCILVDSLEKTETKEAILGLIDFVSNNEKTGVLRFDYYTIPTAIRAVYAIREKGDPKILKASEDFIKKHPCPPKPFLMPD